MTTRLGALMAITLVAGCGARAMTAVGEPESERVPVADDHTAPAGALTQAAAPAEEVERPASERKDVPSVPSSCRGDALDLPSVLANDECAVSGGTPLLPDDLVVSIEPSPVVATESVVSSAVAIHNPSPEPVELRLNYSCGLEHQIETAIPTAGRSSWTWRRQRG